MHGGRGENGHAALSRRRCTRARRSQRLPRRRPARYKLEYDEFDRHLHALGEATQAPPGDVAEMWSTGQSPAWLLTFDDGGASALRIAETLAKYSWQGHFFITGDRIDEPAFVTKDDIRAIKSSGTSSAPTRTRIPSGCHAAAGTSSCGNGATVFKSCPTSSASRWSRAPSRPATTRRTSPAPRPPPGSRRSSTPSP